MSTAVVACLAAHSVYHRPDLRTLGEGRGRNKPFPFVVAVVVAVAVTKFSPLPFSVISVARAVDVSVTSVTPLPYPRSSVFIRGKSRRRNLLGVDGFEFHYFVAEAGGAFEFEVFCSD
jgi:hypothetical protein